MVSGNYFAVLGLEPAAGRLFSIPTTPPKMPTQSLY